MVFSDLIFPAKNFDNIINQKASVLNRFLAVLTDFFILSPVVSFLMILLFKNSYILLRENQSDLATQVVQLDMIFIAFFYYAVLQSVLIYFTGSTPGHTFFKVKINFDDSNTHFFLRILMRQCGHVFSVFLLGFPYLAVLYQKNSRPFYDKIADAHVVSVVPNSDVEFSPFEKRYIGQAYSVLSISIVFLLFVGFTIKHKSLTDLKILNTQNYMAVDYSNCKIDDQLTKEVKIKAALALHILKIDQSNCLMSLVDSVIEDNQDSINQNLAYVSKWYLFKKEGVDSEMTEKYFSLICKQSQFSFCKMQGDRQVSSVTKENSDAVNFELLQWVSQK